MNLRIIILVALCVCVYQLSAQDKSKIKFGKVSAEDFNQKTYSIDSNANAIVIADIGSTKIVGNGKGDFSLEFKRYRRMHILNKNAYSVATIEIPIYTKGEKEEVLHNLKAVTYNLVNGKVIESKLDTKSDVFKDRINKHLIIKKFTFPNLQEGSIIELQYQVHSDFIFNLQPWEFQGEYPCLWSEYSVGIPEFYQYLSLTQGYQRYYIKDDKSRIDNFYITEENGVLASNHLTITAGVTDYHWVMKDVPALKTESYTSTIKNYISRIEFQLSALAAPFTPRSVLGNWEEATADLLKDEDFGASLSRDNSWLDNVVTENTNGVTDNVAKARKIFAFVRDNISCTNHNRKYLEKPVKEVLRSKNGNVAEINLLLTAMLLKAGLTAYPVILSTRSNGRAYTAYPLIDRFNYVITELQVDGTDYFLDASHPTLGFGRLDDEVYNGEAHIINTPAKVVNLTADSLKEKKVTSITVTYDKKGTWSGRSNQTPGFYESNSIRNSIKKNGKEELFNDIKKKFITEVEIKNTQIDSLYKYEQPLRIQYDFDFMSPGEDIIYLDPMFTEITKENPFKSSTRDYPVEMPYCLDETYLLKLDVPEGYTIDELPKPVTYKVFNNEDCFFEYVILESGGIISLRSRICMKRTNFSSRDYNTLREFFNVIVKKQHEQIVFKKKK